MIVKTVVRAMDSNGGPGSHKIFRMFHSWIGLVCVVLCVSVLDTLSQEVTCGISPYNPHGRVVGGQNSKEKSWPWMGSLRHTSGSHSCGATLISERWAITAAHCVGHITSIVFGDLLLNTQSPGHVARGFKVISHPDYSDATTTNDISLLRLTDTVSFSDYVGPACLAVSETEVTTYSKCWVTGWGLTVEEGDTLPNILQEAQVNLFTGAKCTGFYGSAMNEDVMICAGHEEGGIDTCQGDSGGPLVCESDSGTWHLVGITSWGRGCARPGYPGIYTRVSSFMEFIQDTISKEYLECPLGQNVYIQDIDECDHIATCLGGQDEEGCPGLSIADVVELQSPSYPSEYPHNQHIVWLFRTDSPSTNISVHFMSFDLESDYDSVTIGSGWLETDEGSILQIHTGNEVPEDFIISVRQIWIRFTSDGSVAKHGFAATISAIGEDGGNEECSEDVPCSGQNEQCGTINLNNSTIPKCVCNHGFAREEGTCTDVNECLQPELNTCKTPFEVCMNGVGTFWCECKPDYLSDDGCDTGEDSIDRSSCGVSLFEATSNIDLNVPISNWPWIASLRHTNHSCGAVLINEKWAITAAACVGYFTKIVLGESSLDDESESRQERLVTVFSHPQYNEDSLDNNIALLRLSDAVRISPFVRPICLPTSPQEEMHYSKCYIAGWNVLPPGVNSLQEAEVMIYESTDSTDAFELPFYPDTMIGVEIKNLTWPLYSCEGDDGLPLMCVGSNGHWYLAGIYLSSRAGCSPGPFTRLPQYIEFIEQIQNNDFVQCADGKILLLNQICNFVIDCADGLDEANCSYLQENEVYIVTSPRYPKEYPNSLDIMFIYRAEVGRKLFIHFEDFHLEDGYDMLHIMNSEADMKSFTGSVTPEDIITDTNVIWLRFTTDYQIAKSGFKLTIDVMDESDFFICDNGLVIEDDFACDLWVDCPTAEDENNVDCEPLEDGSSFLLKSINYPQDYYTDYTSTHLFVGDEGLNVHVVFLYFDLENGFDFVKIGHGLDPTDESSLMYTLTGYGLPDAITSPLSALWITFVSDVSITKSGYLMNVTITSTEREPCSEFIVVNNEEQSTERYQPILGTKCGISLIAENADKAVELTIEEAEINCNVGEFLVVQRSLIRRVQLRKTNCGLTTWKTYTAGDSVMLIDYNLKMIGHGFRITYKLVRDFFPNFRGCNRLISLRDGPASFNSPGYPKRNYRPLRRCEYRILAHPNKRIFVEFDDFQLEDHESCRADFVKLTDFVTGEESPRYCGDHDGINYNTTSHYLSVYFRSNFRRHFRGFHAEAREID